MIINQTNIISTNSKLPQVIDDTVTEITAEDLAGATKIRDRAFYTCYSLTSITIPDSVTSIGSSAFYFCSNLASVTISNSVTDIGSSAFINCSSLTSVTMGSGVTSIGGGAFHNCNSLTSITIGSGVTNIGSEVFSRCTSLTSITVDENNTNFKSIDGNLYNKTGKTLIQYAIGKTDASFAIPDGVTNITSYALDGCYNLTSLTIHSGVTQIGLNALTLGTADNKSTITFLRTTPPSIYSNTFDASKLEKIIVPAGCGEAYKAATNWAKFADYIEEAAE